MNGRLVGSLQLLRTKAAHIFLGIFFIVVSAHAVYWGMLDDSPDQQSWIKEMKAFQETSLESQRSGMYYGYPGTTLLLASSGLHALGMSYRAAFVAVMACGIAFPVALASALCYMLRPQSLWWIGCAGFMATSELYYHATPPSAIVTPMLTAIFLYALYVYEHTRRDAWTSITLGAGIGITLATRIDISAVIACCVGMFLVPILKKHSLVVIASAIAVFVLLDPYMVAFPVQHIQDIADKVHYHAVSRTTSLLSLIRELAITIPLGFLGMFVGALALVASKHSVHLVPRRFLVLLFTVSVSTGAVLYVGSSYHPVWYFFPLLQIFEVIFLLYVVRGIERSAFSFLMKPVLAGGIAGSAGIFFAKVFL